MNLPIDARKAPFRPKYLDEETPMLSRWFRYGYDPIDGTYFVSNGTNDILSGLTEQQANDIEAARNQFVDAVLKVLG